MIVGGDLRKGKMPRLPETGKLNITCINKLELHKLSYNGALKNSIIIFNEKNTQLEKPIDDSVHTQYKQNNSRRKSIFSFSAAFIHFLASTNSARLQFDFESLERFQRSSSRVFNRVWRRTTGLGRQKTTQSWKLCGTNGSALTSRREVRLIAQCT